MPIFVRRRDKLRVVGDTFRYQVHDAGKVVYSGITTDLQWAVDDCRRKWPRGRFMQIGLATTDAIAREWLVTVDRKP